MANKKMEQIKKIEKSLEKEGMSFVLIIFDGIEPRSTRINIFGDYTTDEVAESVTQTICNTLHS